MWNQVDKDMTVAINQRRDGAKHLFEIPNRDS